MSPLKITSNGGTNTISSEGGSVTTRDKLEVLYLGDRRGRVVVLDHNNNIIGRFELSVAGTSSNIEYDVYVAPIEKGEPTTPMKRSLGVERY